MDGLLGAAALPVDGGTGNVVGETRHQPTGAGDVARLRTDRVDVAEHHILDRARIDARAVDQCLDGMGPEIGRMNLRQGAAAPPDGRTNGIDDVGLGARGHVLCLLRWLTRSDGDDDG